MGNGDWGEEDSRVYSELAPVVVPDRAHQLATIVCLLPFSPSAEFTAVELGCGQGALGATILRCFPHASLVALDGSEEMLARAAALLHPHGERATTARFELSSSEWLTQIQGAGCVVSSLALHHLDDDGKKRLFRDLQRRLSAPGALIIADLVEPQTAPARELFASTWDRSVKQQSGAGPGFERFVETRWNHYRFPDPGDTPSPLHDQLGWLEQAGFEMTDCFWMRAGHAIYGGFKKVGPGPEETVGYEQALEAAEEILTSL